MSFTIVITSNSKSKAFYYAGVVKVGFTSKAFTTDDVRTLLFLLKWKHDWNLSPVSQISLIQLVNPFRVTTLSVIVRRICVCIKGGPITIGFLWGKPLFIARISGKWRTWYRSLPKVGHRPEIFRGAKRWPDRHRNPMGQTFTPHKNLRKVNDCEKGR